MSKFLDFISNFIPITGNATADSILFFLINLIAFWAAWYLTGLLAELIGLDANGMSIIHWIVRIAIWLGLVYIVSLIVKSIRWLFSFEWWVYLIIGSVLLLLTGGIIALCVVLKRKKKNSQKPNN